jgi:hypothetical protein
MGPPILRPFLRRTIHLVTSNGQIDTRRRHLSACGNTSSITSANPHDFGGPKTCVPKTLKIRVRKTRVKETLACQQRRSRTSRRIDEVAAKTRSPCRTQRGLFSRTNVIRLSNDRSRIQ